MDATVNDFLNEINEIAPLKEPPKPSSVTYLWEECYDEDSGYCYYWNTRTDEVTWSPPKDYKPFKDEAAATKSMKKSSSNQPLYIPPRTAPLFPAAILPPVTDAAAVRIYKISDNLQSGSSSSGSSSAGRRKVDSSSGTTTSSSSRKQQKSSVKRQYASNKRKAKSSDSEDERIVLISSYGDDSSDESDNDVSNSKTGKKIINGMKASSKSGSDNDAPASANNNNNNNSKPPSPNNNNISSDLTNQRLPSDKVNGPLTMTKDDVSGFSLVAGYYSDSEEEVDDNDDDDNLDKKKRKSVVVDDDNDNNDDNDDDENRRVAHSTLFPITKPIDVNDFTQSSGIDDDSTDNIIRKQLLIDDNNLTTRLNATATDFLNNKAFQRKRRIGVALINKPKKIVDDDNDDDDIGDERKCGVGFNNNNNNNNIEDSSSISSINNNNDSSDNNSLVPNVYAGFKSGGVMFVKTDVLNLSTTSNHDNNIDDNNSSSNNNNNTELLITGVDNSSNSSVKKIPSDLDEIYTTLKEKLGFLSEGKESVSPVQVMLIQVETLYAALKVGDLKQSYLIKWLTDTSSDLVKLEKAATPDGWLLQWDRSHKRYYYHSEATGDCQWEYPQPDVTRCDEAMDICTTPPPPGCNSNADEQQRASALPTAQSSSSSSDEKLTPPLPPVIRSPTPPPPPNISDFTASKNTGSKKKKNNVDIPLPVERLLKAEPVILVAEKYDSNGEPLPPGVDAPDECCAEESVRGVDTTTSHKGACDELRNELDSFYSDIAALETTSSLSPPPVPPPPSSSSSPPHSVLLPSSSNVDLKVDNKVTSVLVDDGGGGEPLPKKKKKNKVKLAQGLGMKQKGVSKLVEKWKNVQMSYND